MVSLQFSSMWQGRMVHTYCFSLRLSHMQQRPWICNVYRSAICKYSKTSGPVRYVPRSTKLPRQPPTQKQDQHINNGLDVEGTKEHVLKMPSESQVCEDPSFAESFDLGSDLVKQNGETRSRSGFYLEEQNDMYRASLKTQHADESRRTVAKDLQRSSVNSTGISTNMQRMPIKTLDFSQRGSRPEGLFDSFQHFGKYKEQACARSGLVNEEVTVTTFIKTQHAAECNDKGIRDSQTSFADFAKFSISGNTQQARDRDTRNVVGSINLPDNWLDAIEEKVQTRENNLFSFKESNAERVTFPQAVRSSSSLPVQGKHLKKREPDLQGRKVLPCQGVESFLSKVQKAKQRGLDQPHVTTIIDGSLCVDDESDDKDNSLDDKCLFLGQETIDESEDDVGVDSKSIVLNSTAAQEHAKNQAIRYLAMRPYTAFQLRKKLEKRNIMPELADYALSMVQSCGLQSDLTFAETFSRARFNHGSWGPQKIKLGLKQRGISDEIIQVAIARVFREKENDSEQYGTSENCSESNSLEMSKAAMDQLLAQATKQWNRGRNATDETKIRRMVSWLQYRGFKYNVIKTVLNNLQKKIRIEDEY